MTCAACGRSLTDEDRFCPSCGAPLTAGEREPAPVAASAEAPYGRRYPWLPAYPGGPVEAPSSPSDMTWQAGPRGTDGPYAPFGAPLAGWWQRVGALLLDALVLVVPLVIIDIVVVSATATRHGAYVNGVSTTTLSVPGPVTAAITIFPILVGALYFSCFNGLGRGQTPGNRAPGIAVRDVRTGRSIGFWRGVLRWFVRAVLYAALILPGLVNDLFPLWNQRRQTLADMAARSVMIKLG